MKSWAPEVLVDNKWSGNAMRFATQKEADKWGQDLLMRWLVPIDNRSVESDDPVNYVIHEDNTVEAIK